MNRQAIELAEVYSDAQHTFQDSGYLGFNVQCQTHTSLSHLKARCIYRTDLLHCDLDGFAVDGQDTIVESDGINARKTEIKTNRHGRNQSGLVI